MVCCCVYREPGSGGWGRSADSDFSSNWLYPDTPPSEKRRARTIPAFLHHQGPAGVRSVIKLCI